MADDNACGAARFSLDNSMRVTAPGGMHVFVLVKNVNDITFFQLRKTDLVLQRLLLCSSDSSKFTNKKRPLTQTGVIEALVAARDEKFGGLIGTSVVDSTLKHNRYTHKRLCVAVSMIPDTIVIEAPAVHDVPCQSMTVLCTKPTSELWVELNDGNLAYITNAIASEISNGSLKKKYPRDDDGIDDEDDNEQSPHKGVYRCVTRNALRVRYNEPNTGKKLEQWISISELGEAEAMARARALAAGGA